MAYDFCAKGHFSRVRLLVTAPEGGYPDGARCAGPMAGNLFVYRGLAQGRACDFYQPH